MVSPHWKTCLINFFALRTEWVVGFMTEKVLLMIFFWFFSLSLSSFISCCYIFRCYQTFMVNASSQFSGGSFFVVSLGLFLVLRLALMNSLPCESRHTHRRWNHLLNLACLIIREIFQSFSPKLPFIVSSLCALNFNDEWSRRVGVYCCSALYQIWLNSLTRIMSENFCSFKRILPFENEPSTVGISSSFVMETRTQWWSVN